MLKKDFLFVMLIVLLSFFGLSSCEDPDGEGSNVDISITASKVFNAGSEGVEIGTGRIDPESGEEVTISLTDGYFSFSGKVENGSDEAVVIQEIVVEIIDSSLNSVSKIEFSPGSFGLARFYLSHINANSTGENSVPLEPGIFYISGLKRDQSESFVHTVKLTFEGFFTEAPVGSSEIFEKSTTFFKKKVSLTVK